MLVRVHYIYQIKNLVNGKLYIGKHSTNDVNDGYFGSGTLINRAIKKYGIENFRKSILAFFDSEDEAYLQEKLLVNETFVEREDTYNLTCGGFGSWHAVNSSEEFRKEKNRRAALSMNKKIWSDENFRERARKRSSEIMKSLHAQGKIPPPPSWSGRRHKDESKKKIGKANSIHQAGSGNSNFGNVWVHNSELKVAKLIPKEELQNYIDSGWSKGRKMKW